MKKIEHTATKIGKGTAGFASGLYRLLRLLLIFGICASVAISFYIVREGTQAAWETITAPFGWINGNEPPKTPVQIVAEADATLAEVVLEDLATLIADDGETDEQRTFMAHAALNLSKERGGISIETIFNGKLTLAAPSEEDDKWPRRIWAAWTGSEENFAKAKLEAARILTGNNRQEDWKARPCLEQITRYIRAPSKRGTVQSVEAMDGELVLLYENPAEKTRYYGPPGSTKKCN